MTLRYSTGARNYLAKGGSLADMLQNGVIELRSTAQPASADAAASGTVLCKITNNSGAHTPEVLSAGSITLTGGAAGSVNTVTVNGIDVLGGAVAFNGTLAQTASDVADQINRHASSVNYTAKAVGATVTIKALPGTGASPNGFVVTATLTTITASYVNMAGGVTAVNGLKFGLATDGSLSIYPNQVWAGLNLLDGVPGHFRFKGSVVDSDALDAVGDYIRVDGSVSTAGADLNLRNTTLAAGATTTIATATATVPAQ